MKWSRLGPGLLGASVLAVALTGQVPPDYLSLALRHPTQPSPLPSILFIDPVTGTVSPVVHAVSPGVWSNVSAVSFSGPYMFVVGSIGGTILPVIWRNWILGNQTQGYNSVSTSGFSLAGVHRIVATGAGIVFTIRGGATNGLYYVDMTTNKVTVGTTVPAKTALAGDVVVFGDRAYAAFYNTSTTARTGMIFEWVLGGTAKPVLIINDKNPPIAMTASTPLKSGTSAWLHIVNDNGGVNYVVNNSGWTSTSAVAFNMRGIQGLAVNPYWNANAKQYYFAATNKQGGTDVFHWTGKAKKIFTDSRAFGDMGQWTGSRSQGGVLAYGKACRASNLQVPRMAFSGYPTRGNRTFAVAVHSGVANAPCLFALGGKRTNTSLVPNGAPCFLYTDLLVVLAASTTSNGFASIPAPIPLHPSLKGVHAFAQCGIADRRANPAGLITTHGVEYIVY